MASARIALSKNISSLSTKQDAFMKAVEALNGFSEETLLELDLKIQNKNLELEELEKTLKNKEIDGKIECDQKIKEYKLEAALKILEENGLVSVKESELESLKTEVDELKTAEKLLVEETTKKLEAQHKKAVTAITTNSELKHKADHASLTATVEQKTNEIEVLKTTIKNLTEELKLQRELTKDVAMASKQGAINQSFGKQ